MDSPSIRPIEPTDVPWLHEQLLYAIDHGEIYWERRPRIEADWHSRWIDVQGRRYPAFVWTDSGTLEGWVAAGRFHEREAYWPTVELVAWVAPTARGRGIGTALAKRAFSAALAASFHSALSLSPEPSARLGAWLARLGFTEIGRVPSAIPLAEGRAALTVHQRMLADQPS